MDISFEKRKHVDVSIMRKGCACQFLWKDPVNNGSVENNDWLGASLDFTGAGQPIGAQAILGRSFASGGTLL
jgi:hypothetical protein